MKAPRIVLGLALAALSSMKARPEPGQEIGIQYREGPFFLRVKDGKMEYPEWTVRPQDGGEAVDAAPGPKRIVLALSAGQEKRLRDWAVERKVLDLKGKGAAELELQRMPELSFRVRLDGRESEVSWWEGPRCETLRPVRDSFLALCDDIAKECGQKADPSFIAGQRPKPTVWQESGKELDGWTISLVTHGRRFRPGEEITAEIRLESRKDEARTVRIPSDGLEGSFRLLAESVGEKRGEQAIGYFANRNAGPSERVLRVPARGAVEEKLQSFLGVRLGKGGETRPLPPGRYRLTAVLGDRFPPWKLERPSEARSNPVEIEIAEPK